ncbi:formate dehydrogenase subunit gamma [Novispirillum sp. DQ9]|uniref:formate dehydrogenase subunit gamma n=1 Tax=Novispirillum sp. DQ9 TaxID=3398612 RepID=UPI003C7CA225
MPRFVLAAALALLCVVAVPAAPGGTAAWAQMLNEPGRNTATSKTEVQLYEGTEDQVRGFISIPDQKLSVLVQPEGREWREWRQNTLPWVIGGLFLLMLVAVFGFYFIRGRIRIRGGVSGRRVLRFNGVDRFAHWLTAVSFLFLALTGMIVTFGRTLFIPLVGHRAYSGLADVSATLHNFLSLPFVLGLVLIIALWIRDNIPNRADARWIRTMGGLMSRDGQHVDAGRFNAGQKAMFWTIVLVGAGLAVTGVMMMTPFSVTGVGGMQVVHVIHGILAAILIAGIVAHIYIGTLGMEGAFDAMGSGWVDENWAREHHGAWYQDQVRKGHADSSTGSSSGRAPGTTPGGHPAPGE